MASIMGASENETLSHMAVSVTWDYKALQVLYGSSPDVRRKLLEHEALLQARCQASEAPSNLSDSQENTTSCHTS